MWERAFRNHHHARWLASRFSVPESPAARQTFRLPSVDRRSHRCYHQSAACTFCSRRPSFLTCHGALRLH